MDLQTPRKTNPNFSRFASKGLVYIILYVPEVVRVRRTTRSTGNARSIGSGVFEVSLELQPNPPLRLGLCLVARARCFSDLFSERFFIF